MWGMGCGQRTASSGLPHGGLGVPVRTRPEQPPTRPNFQNSTHYRDMTYLLMVPPIMALSPPLPIHLLYSSSASAALAGCAASTPASAPCAQAVCGLALPRPDTHRATASRSSSSASLRGGGGEREGGKVQGSVTKLTPRWMGKGGSRRARVERGVLREVTQCTWTSMRACAVAVFRGASSRWAQVHILQPLFLPPPPPARTCSSAAPRRRPPGTCWRRRWPARRGSSWPPPAAAGCTCCREPAPPRTCPVGGGRGRGGGNGRVGAVRWGATRATA